MNLPTYDANPQAEASWTAVAIAVGALVGAVLAALDVEATLAGAAAGAATAITRWVVGHFLPSTASGT